MPEQVGPYRLQRELRRGGMGVVYLASPIGDGAPLVIKMALRADASARARFQAEIRATRALDHPGAVRVRDEGEHEGRLWYAMDLVGPVNLADVLAISAIEAPADLGTLITAAAERRLPIRPLDQRRGLPIAAAVTLVGAVADTVAHAHDRGILHRDLKPANILLGEHGDPVLADFGVAQDRSADLRLTAVGEVVGTFAYIAPEQLAGDVVDERADVYALGAILHECCTGMPPPRRAHAHEPMPATVGLPRELRAILHHSLAPLREARLPSAAALAAELDRFRRGERIQVALPGRCRRAWWWASRRPATTAGLLMAVVLITVMAWVTWEASGRHRVRWRPPSLDVNLATMVDVAAITRSGTWSTVAAGQQALGPGHAVLAWTVPVVAGQRIEVEAVTGSQSPGQIGVFLAADELWDEGFVFEAGAYENSGHLLRYRGEILWLGEGRLQANQSYRVWLERVGDRIRAGIDQQTLADLSVQLPVGGQQVGAVAYVGGEVEQPVFTRVIHRVADLPELVPADWYLVQVALVAERQPPRGREVLVADGVAYADGLLAHLDGADPLRQHLILRRGALLSRYVSPLRVDASLAPAERQADFTSSSLVDAQLTLLAAAAHRLDRRRAWHSQRLELDPDTLVEPRFSDALALAVRRLSHDELAAFTCWSERNLPAAAAITSISKLQEHFAPGHPLRHYLAWRLAQRLDAFSLAIDPVIQALERVVALHQEGRDESYWTRQAAQALRDLTWFEDPTSDDNNRSPASLLASGRGDHPWPEAWTAILGGVMPPRPALSPKDRQVLSQPLATDPTTLASQLLPVATHGHLGHTPNRRRMRVVLAALAVLHPDRTDVARRLQWSVAVGPDEGILEAAIALRALGRTSVDLAAAASGRTAELLQGLDGLPLSAVESDATLPLGPLLLVAQAGRAASLAEREAWLIIAAAGSDDDPAALIARGALKRLQGLR